MSATRKRKPGARLPEYGTTKAQRDNGRVVLGIERPDPDRPMRDDAGVQVGFHMTVGARAYVRYEHWHSQGLLTDPEREAADRIALAAEAMTGATCGEGGGLKGKAFWQVGGPSARMVQAAADMRCLDVVLGMSLGITVVRCVVMGHDEPVPAVKRGLAAMADAWGME